MFSSYIEFLKNTFMSVYNYDMLLKKQILLPILKNSNESSVPYLSTGFFLPFYMYMSDFL